MERREREDIANEAPMTQQSGYEPMRDSETGRMRSGVSDIDRPDSGMEREGEPMSEQANQRASELSEKARQTADQGRDKAASGMQSAAEKLRDRTAGSEGMAAQAGTKAADTMDKTAGYLREHDTTEILDDVEKYVKEHPVQAVAGAVIGGFLVGRILR